MLFAFIFTILQRFSNITIGVSIKEKVDWINTRYHLDHIEKQDYPCVHLIVHLNIGGNTEVNMEGLNPGCNPGHMDLLY